MKLMIVDGSCYMYRSFYGSNDPEAALRKMMTTALEFHKPDTAIVALDAGRQTFRNELFAGYKSNRPPAPAELTSAVPFMKDELAKMGFNLIQAPGYEADDICGSLCAKHKNDECILLTRDKDFMQLVSDGHVSMWDDGKYTHEAEVFLKFGVGPKHVTEVLGLCGDVADCIPGVPGIGEKVAAKLILAFDKLETVYKNLDAIASSFHGGARLRTMLKHSKELAFLSRKLATIKTDVKF